MGSDFLPSSSFCFALTKEEHFFFFSAGRLFFCASSFSRSIRFISIFCFNSYLRFVYVQSQSFVFFDPQSAACSTYTINTTMTVSTVAPPRTPLRVQYGSNVLSTTTDEIEIMLDVDVSRRGVSGRSRLSLPAAGSAAGETVGYGG